MQVFPLLLFLLAISTAIMLLRPAWSMAAIMALTPLGAGAALVLSSLGNMTVLATTLAIAVFVSITLPSPMLRTGKLVIPRIDVATFLMLAAALWGLISAFLMPRLFYADIEVISLSRGLVGVEVSRLFPTTLSLLRPSTGNLSQSAYFLLDVLFLYAAMTLCRRYGAGALERGILAATVVNIILGMADLVGLDPMLELFQTASYGILADHAVAGIDRIIGGFPEASSFAKFTAVLFAYYASRVVDTGRRGDALLAVLSGALAALSLSSSGLLALGVAGAVIAGRWLLDALRGHAPGWPVLIAAGGLAVSMLLMAGPAWTLVWEIIDILLLSKGDSVSGMERGFWAMQGLRIGMETWGLGVGLGSTLANGMISVWFSNLGAPGLIILFAFLYSVLFRHDERLAASEDRIRHRAAFVALLTILVGKLVSTTTAPPGEMMMLMSAILMATQVPPGRATAPGRGP